MAEKQENKPKPEQKAAPKPKVEPKPEPQKDSRRPESETRFTRGIPAEVKEIVGRTGTRGEIRTYKP